MSGWKRGDIPSLLSCWNLELRIGPEEGSVSSRAERLWGRLGARTAIISWKLGDKYQENGENKAEMHWEGVSGYLWSSWEKGKKTDSRTDTETTTAIPDCCLLPISPMLLTLRHLERGTFAPCDQTLAKCGEFCWVLQQEDKLTKRYPMSSPPSCYHLPSAEFSSKCLGIRM